MLQQRHAIVKNLYAHELDVLMLSTLTWPVGLSIQDEVTDVFPHTLQRVPNHVDVKYWDYVRNQEAYGSFSPMEPLALLMMYTYPLTAPPPGSSPVNLFLIFHLNVTTPPPEFSVWYYK